MSSSLFLMIYEPILVKQSLIIFISYQKIYKIFLDKLKAVGFPTAFINSI